MINPFKLEEYLCKYEFTAPYLLCCSDSESFAMQEIIDMASSETKNLWNNLRLGYTEVPGHPLLRVEISKLYKGMKGDNVICFSGAEEGIFCALHTICEPKDHVIVLTPCYQSLIEIPKLRGCEVTSIALREESAWRIDLEEIEGAIKPNTKCLAINFPHNPTGQTITESELRSLVELLSKHEIWLFSDEVYRLLGNPEGGWSSPAASLYPRALSLGVMSKAYGMAGLRLGWIACEDKELLQKILNMKHYTSICSSAPSEILSLIALQNADKILGRNNKIVKDNIGLLDSFFKEHRELFEWVRPQGGCIGYVNYKSAEPIDDFCARLVKDTGVLLMPASIYDHKSNHFRIGFGRGNMKDALERLDKYIKL